MTDNEVSITDVEADILQRLREARAHRGEWEKVETELRKKALEIIHGRGDGLVAVTASGTPVARISVSTRRSVDAKKLEALYPDVYEQVVKETTVEKLDLL